MRELYSKEMNAVAAAGVVTDDPQIKEVLSQFDDLCAEATDFKAAPMVAVGAIASNVVVRETVKVMDNAFTSIFDSISKLFK